MFEFSAHWKSERGFSSPTGVVGAMAQFVRSWPRAADLGVAKSRQLFGVDRPSNQRSRTPLAPCGPSKGDCP
jgi:hypothetical protein